MTNKIYSFLGLASKAGKLVSGDETCERTIKAGKALMVIVSMDASDNTKKKFYDMCKHRDIELRFFGEKELIGRYTGKEIRSVVCIIDNGFAGQLGKMLNDLKCESGGEFIVKSKNT
ncbi:MAG: ribosomal L7Ae/L30e/S12e/Gadd45 family protein [Clostridia bacterium]|nr:ribosomal L7Ae/L30e/S12e/Gadd45 family protein [Clostridia bacterium]